MLFGTAAAFAAAVAFLVIFFLAASAVRGLSAAPSDFASFLRIHTGEAATSRPSISSIGFLFLLAIAVFPIAPLAAVRGPAAPAGDFALLFGIHGREAACAGAVSVRLLAVAVRHFAVPSAFLGVATFVMMRGLSVMVGGSFVIEGGTPVMRRQAALTADFGHVLPVPADFLAPFASCFRSFFGIEFMRTAALVRCPAALAGDFPLFFRVHGGKAAFPCLSHF
jgi:hypothetical protein